MVRVKDYVLKYDKKGRLYCDTGDVQQYCPLCGGRLIYRDRKRRVQKNYGGECEYLLVRRLRCVQCKRLHIELPDYLYPYKHYTSDMISMVVEDTDELYIEDFPCKLSIKRWKNWKKEHQEKNL